MRKIIVFSMTLTVALLANQVSNAQQPLFSGCSSAGILNQPVWFNCDYQGAAGNGVYLQYRGQSDVTFTQLPMTPVNQIPFYEYTYQANATFSSSPGILEYYYRTWQDSFMVTQSPKNAGNQFPPSMYRYANFISDPGGDMAPGSAGNWLDLTDNGMTYSDTRIYCYLKNVGGTWPQGQFPNYYVYAFGFMITSEADSSFYALVYANVPLLISTGLYRLNLADSTYTRLGNISYNISGGTLHMACDFTVFAADPAWPGWPPPEGYAIPMGATLTAGLSGQMANDWTYLAIYQPETQYLDFGSNNPPALSSARIESDSGISLTPKVSYCDQDGNLPLIRNIHFDSDLFSMDSYDHIYSDFSEFETTLPWPSRGWHRYYFEFQDGVNLVTTVLDSILIPGSGGCSYIPGNVNGQGGFTGLDVVYAVAYLKGGPAPLYSCECTPGHTWYVEGDVNGSCTFTGLDVTYMVAFLKGGPALQPCPDCLPGRR